MQTRCAFPSCSADKSNSQPLFRFPADPIRCEQWLSRPPLAPLRPRPPADLFRRSRLCGRHFEASAHPDGQENVLKADAIPTVFSEQSPSVKEPVKRRKDVTKDDEYEGKQRKIQKFELEAAEEDVQPHSEESKYREYLKSWFEILLLLGEQNIPPNGPGEGRGSSNFQALLEYEKNCGDELLKKRYDWNKESPTQLTQMVEVLEEFLHSKLIEEVKQSVHFSVITDDLVKISGEWCVPVFLRYVDQSHHQQERFAGFWCVGGDVDSLSRELCALLEKWGLDMKQCRGQAHSSGASSRKGPTFEAQLVEEYPKAVLTLRSAHSLNLALAAGMTLPGVQLVLSTLTKVEAFFSQAPALQLELDNAISIYFPDKEDTAKQLREACRSSWTTQNDVFEVAAQIFEPLLLCVDSVHDNEDMRWSDEVAHAALDISKALTDFEFVMALVVLKNTLALTRAFGANLQGGAGASCSAASSLKAVLQSLREVSDNIEVYHEFWTDEAISLAASMEIPIKVPRSFFRRQQLEGGAVRLEGGAVRLEGHYRDQLSAPLVQHVIKELDRLFGEDHLRALRSLSLVPLVLEQHQPEPEDIHVFKEDLPNVALLSEELHCWKVKWSQKTKGEAVPCDVHEALRLSDLRFFPNMLVVFKLLSILPSSPLEDTSGVALKRLHAYIRNTPDKFKSKSLAFLNMNFDIMCDLDAAVDLYMKTYPETLEG